MELKNARIFNFSDKEALKALYDSARINYPDLPEEYEPVSIHIDGNKKLVTCTVILNPTPTSKGDA